MFENRRSEMEIIGEILRLSKEGARKTEILYTCNLSYTQLQNYLSFLLEKDILEETKVKNGTGFSKLYITTEKGDELLYNITKTLRFLE